MFESFESDADTERPWILRPWPLTMVVILGLLAGGAWYLAGTSPVKDGHAGAVQAGSPVTADGVPEPNGARPRPVGSSEQVSPSSAGTTTVAATTTLVAGTAESTADTPSVCGLSDGGQQVPVSPPPAVWRLVGAVAVPTSKQIGPAVVDEHGVGDCFAHSPTGALFAAVGSLAALNLPVDQVDPVTVIRHRVAPIGEIYPAMLAQASAAAATAADRMPTEPGATTKVAVIGFAFTDYRPGRAEISIALAVGDPGRPSSYSQALMPLVMVWHEGDWKLVYTDAMTQPQPITSPDQYIGWAP